MIIKGEYPNGIFNNNIAINISDDKLFESGEIKKAPNSSFEFRRTHY